MKVKLPDYHLHTTFCKHAEGSMESYVERAIELGLDEIGFSDHMPVMPEPQFCMGYDQLPIYIDRVRELQIRYESQISVRLGCEMDMVTDRLDEIRDIIEKNSFDYIIGSIHYLGGWPFDQKQYSHVFETDSIDRIYERFFNTIIEAAKTGLYDITGHIDNIKRMGYRPANDMSGLYEHVAEVLKSMDCTVEVNTSGIDSAAREPYPSLEFLRILCAKGVPVTVGSDSHNAESVGRYYDRVSEYIKEAGYNHIAYFKGRKRILKPIDGTNQNKEVNDE
ncbi:MAG: histidinol-phosphatase HisJ family protein [Candidatus Latescibacteria bacterium]|nr:histidinol-phosphatase HisJ family protein [Candidatus Latescibacterota bacterium]